MKSRNPISNPKSEIHVISNGFRNLVYTRDRLWQTPRYVLSEFHSELARALYWVNQFLSTVAAVWLRHHLTLFVVVRASLITHPLWIVLLKAVVLGTRLQHFWRDCVVLAVRGWANCRLYQRASWREGQTHLHFESHEHHQNGTAFCLVNALR